MDEIRHVKTLSKEHSLRNWVSLHKKQFSVIYVFPLQCHRLIFYEQDNFFYNLINFKSIPNELGWRKFLFHFGLHSPYRPSFHRLIRETKSDISTIIQFLWHRWCPFLKLLYVHPPLKSALTLREVIHSNWWKPFPSLTALEAILHFFYEANIDERLQT